jgi:hypothetical protein
MLSWPVLNITQWEEGEDGCWNWKGMVSDRGYGLVKIGGKKRKAHRVMWELTYGPIPAGLEPHHKCENKRCVRPGHLELVTKEEHLDLSPRNITMQNRAKEECKNGHPFDEANTLWRSNGARTCRICNNERVKAWRRRKLGV